MDEQEFVSLLQALLQPDTQKVKAATGQLNKTYYTSPQSLTALIHILTSHQDPVLRQLASVEARKLVAKHWAAVPEDQKPSLRDSLLQSTTNEEQQLARHSKARVVAAIAKFDLEDGQWGELPGMLQQAATSNIARHREVGVYIIYTLLEASPDRVPHVWPEAGPGGVGGAELGHLALPAQRRWKAAVLADTLRRIGDADLLRNGTIGQDGCAALALGLLGGEDRLVW